MGSEIVKKYSLTVLETVIKHSHPYKSSKKEIFNDCWLYFLCNQDDDDDIGIYLHMECPSILAVTCKFIVNSVSKTMVCTFKKHEGHGFSKFGKKTDLFQNGVMKFVSKINVKFISEPIPDLQYKILQFQIHQTQSSEIPHSVALLDDERFKDFAIQVDEQEIKVHKSIFAAASPVFAAMLEPQTKESKEGRIIIQNFDLRIIKAAVNLIYKRKLDHGLSVKTLLNLYKFAKKYDLADTDKVFEKLYERMSLTTILEISKFSEANAMDKLYNKCVEFFGENFEENTQKMDDFKQLDSQFIADVVMKKYRPNDS